MKETIQRKRLFLLVFLILGLTLAVQAAQASTVVVGMCLTTYPQFTTIGAAVTSVPSGSVIYVCPATYPEQVVITKKLSIIGVLSGTSQAPIVVPPATGLAQNGTDIFGNPVAAQIFVASPSGAVTIERLTVDGTGNNAAGCGGPTLEGIYYQGTSGTITQNAVRNQYQTDFASYGGCQNGLAINVESLTSSAVVTVSYNSVRAYQKNGITATGAGTGAGSAGPVVTISSNAITGLGATGINWQTPGAAENGIQVGFGASGKVLNNIVNDNLWALDTVTDPGDAASGILIFASKGITVSGNFVGSAQFGIAASTDSVGFCNAISCGTADNTVITSNRVTGTQIFDAIDVCSNGNSVQSNTIYGSSESAIHLDDSCTNATLGTTSGNSNTVSKNGINEACAGVLTGTGGGNTITLGTTFNVSATTLSGDTCTLGVGAKINPGAPSKRRRPAPFIPNRR